MDDKSQLLVSPAPYVPFMEPPQYARINTSPFVVRYLKSSSPDCLLNRELIFTPLDNVSFDSPLTGCHNQFILQCGRKPENFIDFGRASSLHSHQRPVFGLHPSTKFSFPSHGYITLNNNPTPSRLAYSTRKNLIASRVFPETSLDLSSRSVDRWMDSMMQMNLKLGERIPFESWEAQVKLPRLCSESAFATWHHPDLNMCNFYSESCPINAAGRQLTNEKSCQLVEPESFLALSCTSNCLTTLAESSRLRGEHGGSTYCSPHGRYKRMNGPFEEKVPSNSDSLLLYSKHDLDFGWTSLPMSDCIREPSSFANFNIQTLIKDIAMLTGDITNARLGSLSKSITGGQLTKEMFDVYDFSSLSCRVSLDEERVWPLLLDKSSWDRSEGAACSDSEDQWTE